MNNTLDVEIGETRCQIGRFKARVGSWILAQVLTKMLPAALESALVNDAGAQLASGRSALSEAEFASIQAHALSVCRRYENGVPMPIFVLPDKFAIPELEYDLVTVMALTVHALVFNLAPFFEGDGLSLILNCLPRAAPNFLASPPSTPSPSGR
jgi:hypothetical protein